MEGKKNLCAMISTDLHGKIMAEKEQLELNTLAEYVERIFTEHFEGGQISMKAERTLAVQIPAELFERLKEYLAARNLKQKQFLIQLIENDVFHDMRHFLLAEADTGISQSNVLTVVFVGVVKIALALHIPAFAFGEEEGVR